jgi:hypothetical protein
MAAARVVNAVKEDAMKLANLGILVVSAMVGPCMIGQEPLHLMGPQTGINIGFTADSIERQDPPDASGDAWAKDVHLKGHVVIRACCAQRGLDEGGPKKAIFIRADEAVYHSKEDQIETLGRATVTFQPYPK